MFFLNESNPNAIVNVNNTILTKKFDHLVCYESINTNIHIDLLDSDENTPVSLPVGLYSKWKTVAGGNGELKIALKHQEGIKNGDCLPGYNDIEVRFPLIIK